MAIAFHCSACAALLEVADTSVGQQYTCPKCGIFNEVPAPAAEVKEAPSLRLRQRLVKWVKRRPILAALSFLAFVIAAVSVTANIVQYRQAKSARAEAENTLSVRNAALNVALAQRALQDNHHDYAVDLLDRCPERFRHWEWHYLRRMAQPTPVERKNTLLTPDGRVVTGFPWIIDYDSGKKKYRDLRFSGDGHYVAILDDPERSVKIWDTVTGALVQTIRAAANEKLKPVSFIDNDTALVVHATGGDADTQSEDRCFDVKSGNLIRTLPLRKGTYTSSPDGPRGVEGLANALRKVTYTYSPHGHFALRFDPDAERRPQFWRLALCNVLTGEEIWHVDDLPRHGGADGFGVSGAISPDNRRVAVVTRGHTLTLWDAATGSEIFNRHSKENMDHEGRFRPYLGVTFSPDGKWLAVHLGWDAVHFRGIPDAIELWDVPRAELALTIPSFCITPHCGRATFSPDSKLLSARLPYASVGVWDLQTRRQIFTMDVPEGCNLAFTPESNRLVVQSRSVHLPSGIWTIRSEEPTRKLLGLQGGVIDNLDFSPDGTRLAAVAQHLERKKVKDRHFRFGYDAVHLVSVWEVETGKRLGPARQPKNHVRGMLFHPDGKRLIFGGWVCDVVTGRELAGDEYTAPFEEKLAEEATDRSLKDGRPLKVRVGSANAYLTFSKAVQFKWFFVGLGVGGETVLAKEMMGWELFTRRHLYWNGSSDGSTRAVASMGTIFDPTTGKKLLQLSESPEEVVLRMLFMGGPPILDALFSHQRRYLATIHRPSGVRLWDGKSGQLLYILPGHSGYVFDLAFSPDGERLFTAGEDRQVKVWNTTTGQEVLSLPRHPSAVTCLALSPDGHRLATGCADGLVRIWDATPLPDGK